MNWKNILFVLAWTLAGAANAIELSGKVTAVDGDIATIAMEGDVLPSVGNKVDVFFKIGKAEVSVGSGKVTEAAAGTIKAKIDNATGTVATDQFVRIETGRKSQAPEKPAPIKSAGSNPLLGDWTGPAPGDAKVSFSFKEDNTLLWVVEQPDSANSILAKYRVDTTATPHLVEFFDIEEGELKGQTLRGFFELQSDGRLKLDLSEKQERGFSDRETILLSRATTPIVRPSPLASSPLDAPTKPPDEQKVLIGHERSLAGDYDGAIQAYTEAINFNSKNASAFDSRGDAFARKEDYDSAINDWQNAIALDPARKQTLEPMIQNAKGLKGPPAPSASSSSSPPQTSTVTGDPTPDPSKPPDEQQIDLGDARYNRRDFDGAIDAYTKAIKLNPKNSWGYRNRGAALVQKDDFAGGIADYEKAIKLDPKRWRATLSESIKDLKKVLEGHRK